MKRMQDPEHEKTVEFILMMDKFFDCVNVSSLDGGKRSRKSFRSPYHSAKDFRIKVGKLKHKVMHVTSCVCVFMWV